MKLSVREELRGKRLSLIRAEIRSSSGVPGDRREGESTRPLTWGRGHITVGSDWVIGSDVRMTHRSRA